MTDKEPTTGNRNPVPYPKSTYTGDKAKEKPMTDLEKALELIGRLRNNLEKAAVIVANVTAGDETSPLNDALTHIQKVQAWLDGVRKEFEVQQDDKHKEAALADAEKGEE